MTETLYSLSNLIVLPAWLLLMVAPNCKWTARATAFVLPFLLGLTYVGLLLMASLGKVDGGFTRLADLTRLFGNPYLALAGWVHYLAYDLFVGSWQVRDAERRGLPHWLVVPCLVLTFVLGPVGLVCYLLIRWGRTQRDTLIYALEHDENAGVRLKAMDGLKPFVQQPEVRKALAGVLLSDGNPGMRTQAIDLLTQGVGEATGNTFHTLDRDVIGTLQELMNSENNAYVRQRGERVLQLVNASAETY